MKTRLAMAVMLVPMVAFAQAPAQPAPTVAPATPAAAAPTSAPAPASVEAVSAICKPKNIRGIWKVVRVQETKPGVESENLRKNPHQYFWFRLKDSLFAQEAGAKQFRQRGELSVLLQENARRDVSQFVLTDTGLLYLYKKGVAVDSFRCRVVQQATEGFKKGDLLLTPAQASGPQFMKVLAHPRLEGAGDGRQAAAQQACKNKKKKNNQRRQGAQNPAPSPVGKITTTPAPVR